jgi:carbon-monoxide dehydrogenase small subunit
MILATKACRDENPAPTVAEIKDNMDGNISRCTGYLPIIKAIQRAAGQMSKS